MMRGIRGATTVNSNDAQEIVDRSFELVKEMINNNNVSADDVATVLFSVTEDLNATFPAKSLRKIKGWTYVPVMCMQEIPVPESLHKCIRVMMTVNSTTAQQDVKHVYHYGAKALRPDLEQVRSDRLES
ncbi:chorismate mutase [Halobacillus sp. A5]|uniref:chorismate mutase n=1 Tax=Halobacillus sp. A5 TaxID=2880263 RepID=UPI0020A67BA3|nr:chorismate mutase [Halobacillus sp. A5]MCP3025860.1 chorismate mutase [Halobacillus sp. A5]